MISSVDMQGVLMQITESGRAQLANPGSRADALQQSMAIQFQKILEEDRNKVKKTEETERASSVKKVSHRQTKGEEGRNKRGLNVVI
ncbi:hypothetical protein Thena_0025 [Thermodesulfobium narugense DSM 14796]|uniref:Uncharacterized protein n=1 Tax=Thermodesulfobium narugense DSM 14796 TaxID=747365 RepID=M1E427_9BACT|nr:hypothetical protein [Thermodesulfobium narugense]AEE13677.1 hypothetical protein Thena_0025 [Thermodesulfobium narugense DSM 14796]